MEHFDSFEMPPPLEWEEEMFGLGGGGGELFCAPTIRSKRSIAFAAAITVCCFSTSGTGGLVLLTSSAGFPATCARMSGLSKLISCIYSNGRDLLREGPSQNPECFQGAKSWSRRKTADGCSKPNARSAGLPNPAFCLELLVVGLKKIRSEGVGGALGRRIGPSTQDKIAYAASMIVNPKNANAFKLMGSQALKGVKNYYGKGVDINAMIGKLPSPAKGWTLPGHNYTGPYNPLEKQLDYDPETGSIRQIFQQPSGLSDAVAMQHDVGYSSCDYSCDYW